MATTKIAINGFGRIGRCILRALAVSDNKDLQVVAINDLCPIEMSAHLLEWDTTHGKFLGTVKIEGDNLVVNGSKISYGSERDPTKLPWQQHGAELALECTGIFAAREKAAAHLTAGAKKVIVSAPASEVDATIVYGVNHQQLKADDVVISNASCTTNCLAPVAKVLHDAIGIESGLMSTVHAYTNDQVTLDAPHKDYRRARTAAESIIPTKTGAAAAIGLVIPELAGKFSGLALRVPVKNVSLVDLSFVAARDTSVKEINDLLATAASGPLLGVLEFCEAPLVSSDFNGNPASSIVDASETLVASDNRLAKVLAWYDNEWGFSNRMLDTASYLMSI